MWRPPERIKYKAVAGPWPTRDEAEGAHLFSPIDIGSVHLEQRTWVPAMVPWRATEDGYVTEEILDWYARFARGRPGAIVVEATGIRDIPSGPLLRIGDDRFIPGLSELAATVHDASEGHTRLFIQLIDFLTIRRRPQPEKYFLDYLKITDHHRQVLNASEWSEDKIRQHLLNLNDVEIENVLDARELEALRMGYRERITDMHWPHIRKLPATLPELFSQAALRARKSGFDGVELHYAHAYTMASFLSCLNDRDDGYGGSRQQRIRLPLEVFQKVRQVVGDDYTVGCRYLSDECINGGSELDDAVYFGVEFARTGFDFLSLSRGGKFEDARQPKIGKAAYPYTGRSGYECMPSYLSDRKGPFGRNVEPVSRIRQELRTAGFQIPVVVAGGIHDFNQAEDILARGDADVIAAARQTLADPDWFRKILLGRGSEVHTCKYTNYCEGLDQMHRQVTCQLWDRLDLNDPDIKFSKDGRRRLTAPVWGKGC
jgi:2,4-dienoyl-CoA reductase-like NADH-dependent reductase (Old Yellow Enzyme family)